MTLCDWKITSTRPSPEMCRFVFDPRGRHTVRAGVITIFTHGVCTSVSVPTFTVTEQISSENSDRYWRDYGSGWEDHWLQFCKFIDSCWRVQSWHGLQVSLVQKGIYEQHWLHEASKSSRRKRSGKRCGFGWPLPMQILLQGLWHPFCHADTSGRISLEERYEPQGLMLMREPYRHTFTASYREGDKATACSMMIFSSLFY